MIKKIKTTLLILVTTLMTLGVPAVSLSGVALAANCTGQTNNINQGANAPFGVDTCNTQTTGGNQTLAGYAATAINVLSLIVGIIAVIMIIYGGLRYITSGGSSEGVGSAKNIIIYAIIGLIIVALAQLIVHFLLNAVLAGNTNAQVS